MCGGDVNPKSPHHRQHSRRLGSQMRRHPLQVRNAPDDVTEPRRLRAVGQRFAYLLDAAPQPIRPLRPEQLPRPEPELLQVLTAAPLRHQLQSVPPLPPAFGVPALGSDNMSPRRTAHGQRRLLRAVAHDDRLSPIPSEHSGPLSDGPPKEDPARQAGPTRTSALRHSAVPCSAVRYSPLRHR